MTTKAINSSTQSGFTIIELLAVTAIIALVSGVVLANNNRFGGQVLLQNLSYDIALSMREAQVYGISVHSFNSSFTAAYGMHFQPNNGSGSSIYVLFADAVTPDGYYDGTDELVQSTTVVQGFSISQLCATPAPPNETEICGLSSLDITFKRPEPDAYIRSPEYAGVYESARIVVASPRGDTKNIIVDANGQISVQ